MKAINISEDWTIEQQEMAIPLLEPIFDALKEIATAGEDVNYIGAMTMLSKNMKEPELLALLWIEDDEVTFDKITYQMRINNFRKMPLKQVNEYRRVLPDFFGFIIPSIISGTVAYFQGFRGLPEAET